MIPRTIAVVGASGAVGRECLSILETRRGPASWVAKDARILALASARSAGSRIPFDGRELTVSEMGERSLDGVDVAFFASGSDVARRFAPPAAAKGVLCIDKSSAFRDDPASPLAIPEVNPDVLAEVAGGRIVAVPNCSTIILLLPLDPIRRAFGLERIVVSTYQAASGAGAEAMRELEDQTRDVQAGRPATPRIFKEPCAFNVFSHDSRVDESTGRNVEEQKMESEARRIWRDPALQVCATCVRVPVLRGHTESITVTLRQPATEAEVRRVLAEAPGCRVVDDRRANTFPTPLRATGGDDVLVGRIRPDPTQEPDSRFEPGRRWRGFSLLVSGDQLRVGAALTAVRIVDRLTRGAAS